MLRQLLSSLTAATFVGLSVPAHADLAQLGDALADVATFGAWGQSRDTHRAEIELLKAQFAQQLQREQNVGGARVATARIEEKARAAKFAQYTGAQLLQIVGTIDVLQAQLKQVVIERAKSGAVIANFTVWFDTFVTSQDDQLKAFVALLRQVKPKDDAAMDDAINSALVASARTAKDAQAARDRLRSAVANSTHGDLQQVMIALADMRRLLQSVIEEQRNQIRQLVNEMHAEDLARRQLCTPTSTIGVTCSGDSCSYYSPDPSAPLPCNDLTYLNAFPVSAIRDIFDSAHGYREYTEFYVSLMLLGTERRISMTAFRSPKELYGDDLTPAKLVPKDFIRTGSSCLEVERYTARLNEGLNYLALFLDAQDRPLASRKNVEYALSLQPVVAFWLQDLASAVPPNGACASIPEALRRKRGLLMAAVQAVEVVGSALTSGPFDVSNNPQSLRALTELSRDF